MSSFDLLNTIKNKLVTNCLVEIKGCKARLEENNIENGKKSKLSSIQLKGLNANYLVLHMDNTTYMSK